MKSQENAGGHIPQPRNFSRSNDRSNLCRKCESAHSDRKYSPKTELTSMASSVFVVKEEVL